MLYFCHPLGVFDLHASDLDNAFDGNGTNDDKRDPDLESVLCNCLKRKPDLGNSPKRCDPYIPFRLVNIEATLSYDKILKYVDVFQK